MCKVGLNSLSLTQPALQALNMQYTEFLDAILPLEDDVQTQDTWDYQHCKAQISKRQSQALQQIYQQAAEGYRHGSAEDAARLHDVLEQLEPISQRQGLSAPAGMSDLIWQHKELQQQIAETQQRAAKLRLVADVEKRQAQFEACLSADEYLQAAECLRGLSDFSQGQQGSGFAGYVQQCRDQRAALQESLQELVDTAIQSESPHQPQLVISPNWLTGAGTDPQEVWRALQSLGSLQGVISKLGKHICQHVLTPLLKLHPNPVCFETHLRRDLDEGSYTIEVSYSAAGRQQGEEKRCLVESAVLQCLQVLKEHAFGNNDSLVCQLGSVLWPDLAQEYITHCMKPSQALLADASQLRNMLDHFSTAEEFETAAVQLLHLGGGGAAAGSPEHQGQGAGAVSGSLRADAGETRIHDFAQHCIDKAMHTKRMQVVEEARDIVVRDTKYETAVVGEDVLLTPRQSEQPTAQPEPEGTSLQEAGPFKITKATHTVMQLMGGVIQEAVSSGSPDVLQSMCNAVLDVALLFTSPSPKLAEQLQQVAQLSCLHYNNCQYLAHELVTLPFIVRPPMGTLLGPKWQFLEEAGDLKKAGQAQLDFQIRRQAQEVVGLLGAAQGFQKVTSGQKGIAARRVVAQVLHSLSKLGDALGGILPSQVYVQAAGQVLQHVLQTVIDDLMSINDISVDESEDLPKILGPLVEEGPLAALGRAHRSSSHSPTPALSPATNKRVLLQTMKLAAPAIVKLQELLELMDVRLVEIEDRWESGRLQTCGFESQEVIHLVKALFEDTEMRRRVLHIVAST
ncbi:hypothetical protein ABBQ38_011722 [Trebouxia sp. C0009 RCD-2024]